MATLVKLPQFGVTMLEATVVAWLKAVGDHVERGDAVASIETDKLSQEVTANATGADRRVVERDVEGAIAARAATRLIETPSPETLVSASPPVVTALTRRATHRFDAMRRIISDRMTASLRDTAQLTLVAEADATALVALRGALVPAAKVYGHRPPTYTDLIVAMVARTLRQHPRLNSSLVDGPSGAEVAEWQDINVGVAVALENGLVVPVVRNADRKPLQTISQEVADLAEAARGGRLDADAF